MKIFAINLLFWYQIRACERSEKISAIIVIYITSNEIEQSLES